MFQDCNTSNNVECIIITICRKNINILKYFVYKINLKYINLKLLCEVSIIFIIHYTIHVNMLYENLRIL